MATTTTPATAAPFRRTCRLIAPNTGTGQVFDCPQLEITLACQPSRRYFVAHIDRTAQGDAYTLARRQLPGEDPLEEVRYVVWFPRTGNKTMCDCADHFYRPHRECKHIASLAALRARGLI